jgi:nitroreductase
MNFLELAKHRFSSRDYKTQPVEEEKLIKILEAGRIAPSAANLQPWHFIVVRDKTNLEKIYSLYQREWFKNVLVVIIICGDHSVSWKREDKKDHCDIDIAIAIDHMTLQATELGLGTCWICNFDAKKCSEIFRLPNHIEPIALLPVAYPKDSADINRHQTKRKHFEQIVHWDRF